MMIPCGVSAAEVPANTNAVREGCAKELFDHTVKTFHLPSAEAKGEKKAKLLAEAASGYQQLVKQYPEQTHWCAQAWRSLGNIRVAQGRLPDALKIYSQMEKKYPTEDWEILQTWKSAADLLWDENRLREAQDYYQKIVNRFDNGDAFPVIKTIVKGAKARLAKRSTGRKDGALDN